MIIFRKIRWKNLLSTGNQFLEIQLDQDRTTIFTGDSGSGKSTLLDAIIFALYNKPFRDINKGQLVNTINRKDCLVEIEFDIGNDSYFIRRGVSPIVFEIHKNGILLNQDASSRDYQHMLEKTILRCNYKSFVQIVVLGAVNFVPFMQLRTQDRRVIIEELLDLEIFSTMNVLLKKRISDQNEKYKQLEYEIRILHSKLETHQDILNNLNQQILEDMQLKRDRLTSLKQESVSLVESITTLDKKLMGKEKCVALLTKVQKAMEKLSTAQMKIDYTKKKLEKEISFYEQNAVCPTCHQSISDTIKSQSLEELQTNLSQLNDNTKVIENDINKFKIKQADLKEKLRGFILLDKEKSKYNTELLLIESKINDLEVDISTKRKNKNEEVDEIQNKISEIETTIGQYNSQIKEINKLIVLQEYAQSLLKDSGIKSKIIKQYLPIINQHVNMFLNSMSFFVGFDLNENFEEHVTVPGKDIFTYGNFSEGEKQRLDLALLFTWRAIAKMKNSIHTNLLIMDEIFDSYLDHEATEKVLELLSSDIFKMTNIFVISHKSNIVDKFDNVIKFRKQKNFSLIGT